MKDFPITLLFSVLDLMPDPAFIISVGDLSIIAVNNAGADITGYTRDQLLTFSLHRFFQHQMLDGIKEGIATLSGQGAFVTAHTLNRADGCTLPVSLNFRAVPDGESAYCSLTIKKDVLKVKDLPEYLPDSRFPLMPLLANAPICVAIFDGPDHIVLATNKFNLMLAGKQNVVGKKAKDAFPEADIATFHRLLDHVYRTGKSHFTKEMSIRVNMAAGEQMADMHMNFLYQPYLNAAGGVDGVLFFGMDVTEQVKARKKVEESELRYRRIVETAQEGIWTIDENNVIDFVNSKMCEIMECGPEEMVGRSVFDFMDEESRSIAAPLIINEASLSSFDFRYITRRGKPIWTSVSVNPIYDEEQQYRGALAMITDITERRQAELMVQKSEERFRNLLEHNEDVIVVADGDFNIFYETPSRERVTGFSPEDKYGEDRMSFIHPDDHAEVVSTMELVKKNPGLRFPWKHRKLHKDGHYIWIEGTIINMLHDESVRAIFTNYRDITERKKAEEALLGKNEQLRSLSAHLQNVRELERAAIAREIHDELGQQLTGLKMEASWIHKKLQPRDGNLPEKMSGIMRQIDETINAVRRLSTDLRPPILDDFGLAEAIKWQAADFEQRTDIVCKVDSNLDGDITDQHIALTLFRVFQESLANVARHSKATEVHALIEDSGGQLSLTITDDGIGINEDFIKQKKTLGILGMTERIAMVNGRFYIARNGDRGTVIQVTVPYQMKPTINQKAHD